MQGPSSFSEKQLRKSLLFARPPAIVPFVVGMWLSLVEYRVRDAGVAGSNPAIPTRQQSKEVLHSL